MVMVTRKRQSDKGILDLDRIDRAIADRNAKAQDEITVQVFESVETAIGNCDEVEEAILQPAYRTYLEAREGLIEVFHEGARPAYRNYIEARKGLSEALRQRVRRDQDICREAELQYQLCESAIEIAIKLREEGELQALDEYRDDVNKAVRKAVNKASKAYKDKMEQLRIDCQQRIMNAWRDSIETSTRMAGAFEQDRIWKSPQDEGVQLKRSFLTVIRRIIH